MQSLRIPPGNGVSGRTALGQPGAAVTRSEVWGLRPPADWAEITGPFRVDLLE